MYKIIWTQNDTFRSKFTFFNSIVSLERITNGKVYTYGNSHVAPYSEQFYVGGANSIRAFTVRSIGPGGYHPEKSEFSYLDQTGDIRLEANI